MQYNYFRNQDGAAEFLGDNRKRLRLTVPADQLLVVLLSSGIVTQEQAGNRPVLILSQDIFNERSGTVIAVALTSQPQRAGFPLTLELKTVHMPKRSWVKISQIRTLAVERIGNRIGRATPE